MIGVPSDCSRLNDKTSDIVIIIILFAGLRMYAAIIYAEGIGRSLRTVGALLFFFPLICSGTVSRIEAQNLADTGRDFANELRTIEQCKPYVDVASSYRETILKFHLLRLGEEKFAYFKQGFERIELTERQISERDCAVALFKSGKSHQSMGVTLAVENADEELIPRKLVDANQATTFGGQIADRVSQSLIRCIPDTYTRKELLKGFRPLVLDYMQNRFSLRPGFEKNGIFSGLVDLFGYESENRRKAPSRPRAACAYDMYVAGQVVRLLEQLAELEATPDGIWLDRRLRGVQ